MIREMSAAFAPSPPPRAVLFDMDGTLTEPMLDFPRIKAEMGIGTQPILEALAEMNEAERRHAEVVLLRHEEQAAAASTLNPGCTELLNLLSELGISTALITRNSRLSVRTVLERHRLAITVLVTRDDGRFKPDPEPLCLACRALGVRESEVWMVGDGQYDVEAGLAAGVRTVWVSHGRPRSFAAAPWRVAGDLFDVAALVREALGDPKPR
jgi:HAD superfamily hydrolase (TIGR01509 family)